MARPTRRRSEPGLIELAYRHGLPLVATNDVYFPDRDFYEAHDALLCIAQGTVVADADRKRLTRSHYFRPAAEMREVFADLPEACDNTLVIAQRCAFIPQPRKPILPAFPSAEGATRRRALRRAALAGLDARLTALGLKEEASVKPYRERLDFELDTIIGMGFAGYFLIVADFIQWAKRAGHPGRARARLGRRLGRRLGVDDHRSRPAALRPAVRAVPQPRAGVDAGFRHRFLPGPARRGDPLRPAEIRPRPRRADHHLRQIAGPRGVARCRPRARDALWPGRPPVQAGAEQPGASGHPRTGDRRRAGSAAAARRRRERRPADHDRAQARRPLPARLDPCRGRGDRRPAVGRTGAALSRPALRHAGHSVQHEMGRARRAREIRLPRPQDSDGAGAHPASCCAARGVELDLSALPLDDPAAYELLARGDTVGVFQVEGAGVRDMLQKAAPGPVRGHHRRQCALPAGADGEHPAIHRGQARRRGARLPAPGARGDPQGNLRRHDLPGAGHADRPGLGRLYARRRRPVAPRDGQEDPGGDGRAAPAVRRGRGGARGRARAGRADLRPDGEVRRLRLQQIACRGLCAGRLSDRLSEGQLPGRVSRRVDDARPRQYRQAQRLPAGIEPARHPAAAAGHQPLRGERSRSSRTRGPANRRSATRSPR